MSLSDAELRDIVERASTFAERLDGGFEHGEPAVDDQRVQALLVHWQDLIAPGDLDAFERRLAWDGLDEPALRRALGRPRLAAGEPLPAWSSTLRDVIGVYEGLPSGSEIADRALDPDDPVPFEEVVLPFIMLARCRLLGDGEQAGGISRAAMTSLERALLRQLAELFRLPLYREFAVQRATRQTSFSRLLAEASDTEHRHEYYAFVSRMRSSEIAPFFLKFPVLARLASEAMERWVESCAELIDRLDRDREEIGSLFGGGENPGDVVAFGTNLSDAHHGGRSVVAVRFSSGLRLIYKPRDLGPERAYFSLLSWLNEHESP